MFKPKNKEVILILASVILDQPCPKMDFANFPFDTQTCPIAIGGLGVRSSEVEFILDAAENQNITDKGGSTEYEISTEILTEETLETIFDRGSFPRMGFQLVMERISSLYLLSLYLPSGMFVTISWISYLIPPEAYPGRVGLLLTTFLMLTNMFMGVMQSTPTSGGINQIQVWLLSCILFVMASGIAYFIILLQIEMSKYEFCKRYKPGKRPVLDNIFLILSPTVFFLFLIIYFPVVSTAEL